MIGPLQQQIRFNVDTSSIDGFFPAKGGAIVAALMQRTTAINSALQAKIAGDKLQGNPIKSHTNKLAGSVRVIPTRNDGTKIAGGVQAGGGPAFYAKYLEDGSQPHIITVKNAKALAFEVGGATGYSPWGGKFSNPASGLIFVKMVHHPGTQAYLFMKGTLKEEQAGIMEQLKSAAREGAQ
jgi:hypothetical protein